jgi:DNA-binding MarR family transcriptional regulator
VSVSVTHCGSSAGKSLLRRLDKAVDAAQDALLAPLSARDRRELRRLLALLAQTP